jgi:TRAP transporter 4TM/12TM fusion protein
VVFWIVTGVACAAFFEFGLNIVIVLIVALIAANLLLKGSKQAVRGLVDALAFGAKNALGVGIACAIVGIIIGTMTLTGLASNFARVVVAVGENSLFLSLLMTALACLVLGMGIPTIPNYIITSSLAGPALLELGVPLIVSHMFVFYFGIMADLTPPVALAAFAASVIAKADAQKIGWIATRIAIAGYIIPFMAVYDSSLMLQSGTWLDTIYVTIKALVALVFWGAAMTGWLKSSLNVAERVFMVGSSCLLVASIGWLDELGLALSAGFVIWHWWRSRSAPAAPSRA